MEENEVQSPVKKLINDIDINNKYIASLQHKLYGAWGMNTKNERDLVKTIDDCETEIQLMVGKLKKHTKSKHILKSNPRILKVIKNNDLC